MTLLVELDPEQATLLLQEAARHGLGPDRYVRLLIEQSLTLSESGTSLLGLSAAQRAAAFREWAEGHSADTPPLSDEAVSRQSIYGE